MNQEAFSVVGAMGLLHRKGAREDRLQKTLHAQLRQRGGGWFLSLRMTWPASNFRKKSCNLVKTSLHKKVTREKAAAVIGKMC